MIRTPRILGAATLLVAAACSNGSSGPDTRCHGAAQVPAWNVAWTVSFADTGTAKDSFAIRLHHDANATGLTGPDAATTQFDGVAWFTRHPTGTLAVNDSVITLATSDTAVGVATLLTPAAVGAGSFSGGYVAIDLATCTADIGSEFWAEMHHATNGFAQGTDTVKIGYSLVQNIPVDSAAVANGWTIPAQKVATKAGAYDFVNDRQYLALSLSGRYAPGVAADSATISFTVTPAAVAAADRP